MRWQCDSHLGELLCNRDTLVGALLNLIENATQASAPGARLKIHLYSRAQTLRLCISDSGSGNGQVSQDVLRANWPTSR